jgi:Rad3-related DNA helicase
MEDKYKHHFNLLSYALVEYERTMANVPELLEASQGHALVLFTSYEALKSAHEAAKPRMEALGI